MEDITTSNEKLRTARSDSPEQALRAMVGAVLVALLAVACSHSPPRQRPPITEDRGSESVATRANAVLFRAIGLVGTPYRWGGNTPDAGFDCSGLVGYVYRDAARLELPRTSSAMSQMAAPKVARDHLQSGDLLFFASGRRIDHVGIYVGEGRFVHAPNTGGTVRLDPLENPYWSKHFRFARRPLEH